MDADEGLRCLIIRGDGEKAFAVSAEDFRTGEAAFLAKKKPEFKGR